MAVLILTYGIKFDMTSKEETGITASEKYIKTFGWSNVQSFFINDPLLILVSFTIWSYLLFIFSPSTLKKQIKTSHCDEVLHQIINNHQEYEKNAAIELTDIKTNKIVPTANNVVIQ